MEKIDRKFKILAVNPFNGNIYTEKNSFLMCAKDKAVPAALAAYEMECIKIGANPEHILSVNLLRQRVKEYQAEVESRVPDTVGDEIPRCLFWEKTIDKEQVIEKLWENSGHGTRRQDIETAYEAGVAASLNIAKAIHAEAADVAHPDAEFWTKECVERIELA